MHFHRPYGAEAVGCIRSQECASLLLGYFPALPTGGLKCKSYKPVKLN